MTKVHESVDTIPLRVRSVRVRGAKRTSPSVFDVTMASVRNAGTAGAVYTSVATGVKNLRELQAFRFVKAEVVPLDDEKDRVDVEVSVTENSIGNFYVGSKVGNTGASLDANVALTNMFGRAEKLTIGSEVKSSKGVNVHGVYDHPLIWGVGSNASIFVNREIQDYRGSSSYVEDVKRGGVSVRFSKGTKTNSFRYELSERQMSGIAAHASPEIRKLANRSLKSSVIHEFSKTWATRGGAVTTATFLNEVSGLGGEVFNAKHHLSFTHTIPFALGRWSGLRVRLQGLLGFVEGYSGDHVRIQDRLFLGGHNLRGFAPRGVGPRDGADALGGNVAFSASVGLSFPLPNPALTAYGLRGHFFVDVGNVADVRNAKAKPISVARGLVDSSRAAIGCSVSLPIPIGMLELRLTHPLVSFAGDRTHFFEFGLRPSTLSF